MIPLLTMLFIGQRRAARAGTIANYKTPFQAFGFGLLRQLFWQLDIIGIVLMVAAFCLFLVPFTIAGQAGGTPSEQWSKGHILAPLIVGILCMPAFIFWESKAQFPTVPFRLLKDRGVWAAMLIGITYSGCTS